MSGAAGGGGLGGCSKGCTAPGWSAGFSTQFCNTARGPAGPHARPSAPALWPPCLAHQLKDTPIHASPGGQFSCWCSQNIKIN